ncbi:YnbE family lipoprotein [Shewanella glacialipiscicola]|uniref:YnbE family lipoprotein n=1 Tax=Shewanella glacialipiscicola TaxID=614069 RepID=A0ABQ6J4L2_9GAMM|nr:YnbE family lipoprotein [Shewanella glacialipiscicola]MCL1085997.1 YnbE family lipoprotein [Shewanella glacialipiscicola]MCU7993473.1 YnbE family lipoprotein [Shewanella glacialipiscicola]MCU8024790.1 YnbE family lipoprotein [Shewanella glacialipiscicola]GIU09320.1 YnbE family lipoprotein [Shewanella glacialipiscicola]GMA81887.1 YnbE family lipoprotein [Shewanella glacialipiscicola]
MKIIQLQQVNIGARSVLAVLVALVALQGCAPTVKIEPPDKPIVINLNVKIEHEIRIKVDKELDQLLSDDKLF